MVNKMLQRFWKALGLALTLGLTLAAGSAWAQPVNYQFSGTFDQNLATGNFSGTFTYDPASDSVTAATVTVQDGLTNTGAARVVTTYNVVSNSAPQFFIVTTAPTGAGNRAFLIQFLASNLNAATPAASAAIDLLCNNAACTTLNNAPSTTSTSSSALSLSPVAVAPAAIPTMSEWAMIFFGVLLAGGAALYIQRRQMAV